MTATSLHFGPEWMRNKQQTTPSTTRPPASLLSPAPQSTTPPVPPGASSYSSLLTPAAPAPPEKQDSVNPFKYSKEEMLQVWKDGGGHGALGLEVELWEGVVREIGEEPISLKEMSEGERKLFSMPLNSDLRRRQSHDFLPTLTLATGDRPKLPHAGSSIHSPLSQQRYGALVGRRRKEDGTDSGPPLSLPRRLSLTSISSPLGGPLSPGGGVLTSPRTRLGSGTHGLDGVLSTPGDGSWRKRDVDPARAGGGIGGVEERDEELEGGGKNETSGHDPNGSFQDANMSRSTSGRSMAPSPPSTRGDFQQEVGVSLASKLEALAMVDDRKKPHDMSDNLGGIDTRGNSMSKSGISAARPPGLEEDLANVSWSYRDPKGNIQGPFAATLMQKWYDEGYFTPDLLMKRTHMDTDWTPVGDLALRAGNEKLFFSSFADSGPPGLAPRPVAPPVDNQAFDRFGQPLGQTMAIQNQPQTSELITNGSPLRHLPNPVATRPATLDSYLATSSSNPSDSQASSFTAAIGALSSASPDLAFGGGGGRPVFGNNSSEPAFGGRVGNFDSQPSSFGSRGGSSSFNAANVANDPSYSRLASLGHRGPAFENQGFNNLVNPAPASPWSSGLSGSLPRNSDAPGLGSLPVHRTSLNNGAFGHPAGTNVPGFNEPGNHDSTIFGSDAYNYANAGFSQPARVVPSADPLQSTFGPIGLGGVPRDQSLRPLQDLDGVHSNNRHGMGMDDLTRAPGGFVNGYGTSGSPIVHGQASGFGVLGGQLGQQLPAPQQVQSSQQLPPIPTFNQPSIVPSPSSPHSMVQPQQQSIANHSAPQSPWGVPETTVQPRPRPFDAPHPTSRNVVSTPITPNDALSYNRPQSRPEVSEWYNTSKPELDDGWGDISAPTPVTDQGNGASQGHQPGWTVPSQPSPAPLDRVTEQTSLGQAPRSNPSPPSLQPPQTHTRESTPQTASKKRVSGPVSQSTSKAPANAPGVPAPTSKPPSPLPSVSAQARPAWSTPTSGAEDEIKATKPGGLREIQEAEAKRLEAKKVAEREKERASRAQPQEETQTFTASWGLPTSQAGAARSAPREQAPTTPSHPATPPVWTNAGKPPQTKRTMKEIQEEEERRKKAAAKERETAAAAARRAYADSANKSAPGLPVGGAWTTVGSSGKTNTTPPGTRQVSATGLPTSSSQTVVRSPNGIPVSRAGTVPPQPAKPSVLKHAPADDGPVPPSPEFMKWLREAVRGFNPGFNTEEFMAMLLTFALDFPPSTVEVIQDMVYMNSATLDGRRFAADFCSRRKADAANRPKGWGASAGGKPPSLADVVKTQPKPTASEIPFKMVKKKGRGGAVR